MAKANPKNVSKPAAKSATKSAPDKHGETSGSKSGIKGGTKIGTKLGAKAGDKAHAPSKPIKTLAATPAKSIATKSSSVTAAAAAVKPALTKPLTKAVSTPRSRTKQALSPESVCREVACEGLSTTGGYCRLHYIKNWKKVKRKEQILRERKLNQYIEELVAKYPDKYIEAIRQDLANDKEFAKVISDLDLDENIDEFETEGEPLDSVIDTIKRDFDDESEGF